MYRDKQINLALLYVGAQSFANARFGRGTGPLLLDRLRCTGREQYLLNCSHSGVGVTSYYCGHDDDAGVRCQGNLPMLFLLKVTTCTSSNLTTNCKLKHLKLCFPVSANCTDGQIRLRGGANMREGRVEICINRSWGTICDSYWDYREAEVACRQLGFPSIGKGLLIFCPWTMRLPYMHKYFPL